MRRHTFIPSPLGDLQLVADGDVLIGVYFEEHSYPPSDPGRTVGYDDPLLATVGTQIVAYLDGHRTEFDIPIRTDGDEFSERVWALLRDIPYGETTTYGRIAEALGRPGLAQRVGQAVGHNPISIVVPCHRVVGADGSLTGYAGGLTRKRTLLELESSGEGRLF